MQPGARSPERNRRVEDARPDQTRRLTLARGLAAVGRASDWLRACGDDFGLVADDLYRLDLCASELLTNIASYAYADDGPHQIELNVTATDRQVTLEILDDGRPFNPVEHPLARPATSLADAGWGGWGLRLVRQFADECRYARRGETNVFSLVIRREAGSAAAGTPRVERGPDRRANRTAAAFPLRRGDGSVIAADGRSGVDRRLLGFISRIDIFRGVPFALLEDAIADCRLRHLADGAVLVQPGEHNASIGFVVSGRLRVHLDAPDSQASFTIEAGDCFGEMSVIDGEPASAYVVADAGCRILFVAADVLFDRLLSIPAVNRNFMTLLAERVRRTSERIVEQQKSAMGFEQLQREVRFASEIQAGMLPVDGSLFPERTDVDCAARIRTARQVGGDFYDAFFVDQQRLLVTIGDVCGKGLSAALFMVRALTLLRSEATRRAGAKRGQLQRTVDRLNRLLCQRNDASLFVTMIGAILDTATGELVFVNAGHHPPLLALGDGSFQFLLGPRHPMIGIVPDRTFAPGEATLPRNSALILYTDGVTDALTVDGESFGETRLIATLNAASDRSATRLVDEIVAALDDFTGGTAQTDDIAVLALRYVGPDH
jgi:sigma-B regulation protein RsbU (phosphoserine phosphatase)